MLRNLLDQGVAPVGDPDAMPRRRARRARAEIRRRHRHAPRLRAVQHRRQPRRRALLRRGRGFLAQALRHLGPADRPAARPDRLFDPRRESGHAVHAVGLSRRSAPTRLANLPTRLGLDPAELQATVAQYNAAVRTGTFDNTKLDDCRTEGLTPPKTHWARTHRYAALLSAIRCGPASPSPISACR